MAKKSNIEIRPVAPLKSELRKYVQFGIDLYAGNDCFVPPLVFDEINTFMPDKNPAFEYCRSQSFMAYRDGVPVGRITAIVNTAANKKFGKKDVRFGWVDFIDDKDVVNALFKAVEVWGRRQGMTRIVGPMGFSDMDPEGMLTWGFDKLGTMATIYNYDYYPRHMEQMGGWAKDNDYVEYFLPVPDKVPEKYAKIASLVEKRYNLHVKKLTRKDVFQGGWGRKLFEIINATYTNLYGFVSLTDRQIDQYVKMYMPMVDLNLVTVIVDGNKNDAVAGMGITIPSLSHALQKCRRGRLLPTGWWHVLRAIKFHKTEGVDLLLVGFLPEYRAKGANALLFSDLIPRYVDYGIKWGETQVEMESNEGVQGQWGALNPINHKRRRCYRKEL